MTDVEVFKNNSKQTINLNRSSLDYFLFEITDVELKCEDKKNKLSLELKMLGATSVFYKNQPIIRKYELIGTKHYLQFLDEMNVQITADIIGKIVKVYDDVNYPYVRSKIRGINPVRTSYKNVS